MLKINNIIKYVSNDENDEYFYIFFLFNKGFKLLLHLKTSNFLENKHAIQSYPGYYNIIYFVFWKALLN